MVVTEVSVAVTQCDHSVSLTSQRQQITSAPIVSVEDSRRFTKHRFVTGAVYTKNYVYCPLHSLHIDNSFTNPFLIAGLSDPHEA